MSPFSISSFDDGESPLEAVSSLRRMSEIFEIGAWKRDWLRTVPDRKFVCRCLSRKSSTCYLQDAGAGHATSPFAIIHHLSANSQPYRFYHFCNPSRRTAVVNTLCEGSKFPDASFQQLSLISSTEIRLGTLLDSSKTRAGKQSNHLLFLSSCRSSRGSRLTFPPPT